jgi:GNAT superfamily N-acetyltransferase
MERMDRMIGTMRSAFAAWAGDDGRWLDDDGIGAIVMPHVPERSLVNSVIYERGANVAAAYDRLAALYSGAWMVWVPQGETETATFLESKGHRFDGQPAAMMLELDSFTPPPAPPSWEPATMAQVGRINEATYPWRDGSLERALLSIDEDAFHLYVAEDATVVGIHDCDGDAGVFFVATLPEARGRGLAAGLMGVALEEARERGCDVSTLQASPMGEPVYERMGYETLGRMELWERR